MKSIILITLFLATIKADIQTVEELDIDAYLGTWYEVVSSPIVHQTFEKDGYCSKAIYSLRSDGSINVLNAQRIGSKSGNVSSIEGFAYQIDPENFPGKLIVDFGNGHPGNYWIVQLGPIVDGKYDYSIVSEPNRLFMWVLSRDPSTYYQRYGQQNKDLLVNELGFTSELNKYVERDRENCVPF